MALHVRLQYASGSTLKYSIERLSDSFLWDFSDSTFKASPGTPLGDLTAGSGNFVGKYTATIADTSAWSDGGYCIGIHDATAGNAVVGLLGATMIAGDDANGQSILAADALDLVPVETGVNARQALSPILAAAAGVLSGAGTGTVIIQGGNVVTPRITATTDSVGNRSNVVLSLPA